eukprot:8007738-Pyramimonas_sp.AAC.1
MLKNAWLCLNLQERARTLLVKKQRFETPRFNMLFWTFNSEVYPTPEALKDVGMRARRRARVHFPSLFAEDPRDDARAFGRF